MWRHIDFTIFDVTKRMLEVGGLFLNILNVNNNNNKKKNNFWQRAHIVYKMTPTHKKEKRKKKKGSAVAQW